MKWLLPIAVVLLIVGIVAWWRYFMTYHFVAVADGVRSVHEFETAARKAKPKTVIRLIDENERKQEPFVAEAAYCQANGIEIIELPIKLGGWPRPEQVDEFL